MGACFLAALGLTAAFQAVPARAATDGDVRRLMEMRCPEYVSPIPDRVVTREQIDDAKRGYFYVLHKRVHLEPPINWEQDPFNSDPWQGKLQMLTWLDPLLYAHSELGDRDALRDALKIVLDWVDDHPRPTRDRHAWERKRASDRTSMMVYVIRASACEDLLRERQAKRLLNSAGKHGEFLYKADSPRFSNHGLVRDLGLLAVAEGLPFLPRADEWRQRALDRFQYALFRVVNRRTGVHLQHTPGYQPNTVSHVSEFLSYFRDPPSRLSRLLARMRNVMGWFVAPDDLFVPIADTHYFDRPPGYALESAPGKQGLSPFSSDGYAIVKDRGSYFATAAGYHRDSHKHADELTFNLYEGGRRVIVDGGRRNLNQKRDDPGAVANAAFTKSSFAHSTLTVDDESFKLDDRYYGSAIDATGQGSGWYAAEGNNPLVARHQGVRHSRLFLYRPGQALVVVDDVRSDRRHLYGRYVQIAPGIDADRQGATTALSDGGFQGTIWNEPTGNDASTKLYYGDDNPFRGWYVPGGYDPFKPRNALLLRSRARSIDHLMTVAPSAQPVTAELKRRSSDVTRVIVDQPGRGLVEVRVLRDHGKLTVTEGPAS